MATHCRILAWRIPRTEEPGGLQSGGSQRVGHGLVTEQQPQKHPSTWRKGQEAETGQTVEGKEYLTRGG